MNLARKRLDLAFAISLILTIMMPVLAPSIRILFFAPFIIMVVYRKPRVRALWIAAACGLLLDLLSSQARLGIHAISFALATMILFPQRRHFFADSLSTLPIMTFLFSVLSTVNSFILYILLEREFFFSPGWMFTDLILMPLCDACYAFVVFILPARLYGRAPRKGHEYFLSNAEEI